MRRLLRPIRFLVRAVVGWGWGQLCPSWWPRLEPTGEIRATENGTPDAPASGPRATIEALDVLVQIMLNEKAPPNARVAAANTLLDRAYGKAPTFSTSDTQAFKRAIDMTDDELAAIVAKARLTVK